MSKNISPELLQNFRKASRLYSDTSILMHEAIARKAGLSGTDHKYLGTILDQGQLTAGQIAKLTGLTTGAVTGLIDRLERKKLVKRQYSKEDRRKVLIVAQKENAIKLLEPIFDELQRRTAELISGFNADEISVIHRYFIEASNLMKEITNQLNNPNKT